jgi:undecaprenyl diphosphate synthase
LCSDKGIEVLTLFAFSTENWNRSKLEVNFLMRMFVRVLTKEIKELHKEKARIIFIGDRESLSKKLQQSIANAETLTKDNVGIKLVIALNYSGRWDIANAARKLAKKVEAGAMKAQDVTLESFHAHTQLAELPPPDLFIRTSGELRLSNFMLWQLAYTELYFTDILWPDFRAAALEDALLAYAKRDRRFGTVKNK